MPISCDGFDEKQVDDQTDDHDDAVEWEEDHGPQVGPPEAAFKIGIVLLHFVSHSTIFSVYNFTIIRSTRPKRFPLLVFVLFRFVFFSYEGLLRFLRLNRAAAVPTYE